MANLPVAPAPLRHRLIHFARRLAGNGQIKIVAIGSSTTEGEGNIRPYPARLQDALKDKALQAKYPNRDIVVLNKGKGGQEAPDELKRFQQDVLDEKPDVVIWQVGTNAVYHGDDLDTAAGAISHGLDLLSELSLDVVVMDLQYLPAVLTSDKIDAAERMVALIADAVTMARRPVNLFKRFDYMRAWHDVEKRSFDSMVDPTDMSRLHHSDWSIQRITDALAMIMFDAMAPTPADLPPPNRAAQAKLARRRPRSRP